MKYIRKFNSIEEMRAAIAADEIGFIGMVHPEGEDPTMNIHVHEIIYPHDLVISCENNIVTITAEPAGEVTIEYRFNYEGEYVTYTGPFPITETVMVTARATTEDGSINRSQQCEYVALPTNLTITCENNTVTITADNATTIEYNFDGSSTYTTYTQPFAITQTVTVYAKASSSAGSITGSQECEYVNPIEYSIPFYIEDVSGSTNTVQIKKSNSSAPTLTIQKSTDGTTWESMGTTSTTAITSTIPANGKLYLRCSTNAWATSIYNNRINTTSNCNVGGNIMSLLYGSNFTGKETTFPNGSSYNFRELFLSNTHLVDTSSLILPATTLTNYCYESMFQGCTSLTTAPELPATTLANYCYHLMFQGCTSLTTAPELPATTLAESCYYYMFSSCTSLTTAPSILPATTLAEGCYYIMFSDCTSLTTAPVLPATTLTKRCYARMFFNCTKLNYIKCLATNISASDCTENWVYSVSSTGTFVKDPSMESWSTGSYGIPTGWTVKDSSGISLTQSFNVTTIKMTELDEGTGYYTINGGSQVSIGEGTTAIPITQAMDGQTLLVHGEFDGVVNEKTLIIKYNANAIPFYIEDISGSTNTVQIKKNNSSAPALTIEKSLDGITWTSMGTTSTTAITATIPANGKLYLKCKTNYWGTSYYYNTINTTGNCNVGGNTMSLLYGSNVTGNETTFPSGSSYNFRCLFNSNTHIVNASDLILPATTLTSNCYYEMFSNCTALTTAPVLPATTLANSCYGYMFQKCTSLTTAPALPAITLANYCYSHMFSGCTSLTTAPELPATTLAESCYYYMFSSCTSLTTAPSILPATTLANYCYSYMFFGCTSLTTAPTLPATTLVQNCYNTMFSGCTKLNYIKCLATDISASSCTSGWVYSVSSRGTFVKNSSMTNWTTGTSGIPTGWTVKNNAGIALSQNLNVTTIKMTELDEGTGYYTINGGSQVSIGEGTTAIPITQAMDGQTLLVHGEFDGEPTQETITLDWVDYSPTISISASNNYVTVTAPNANTIQYRLGSTGEYTNYTAPVYINEDTTIYVTATRTVSGVDYTSTASKEVQHVLIPPSNLNITCSNNFVSITATGAATLEYNLDGGSTYTTYTVPFFISQSETVYAKATNSDGSITKSQAVTYVDYRPTINITENNNYVTITAANANTIQYRLGSTGEYTNYTAPVYIASDTTIYVTATRTVSGVDYTSTTSKEVEHETIPPTNLVISCSNNKVTITATNATTIEYNFDGSSTYTSYTQPFEISETVTVYAKATNSDGSITGSQECVYSGYIGQLISMGCKFWAPLDENDITEKLSETAPTHRAGQLTWDSTKNAYKFKTTSGGQQVLVYSITDVNNVSSTLAYTLIADVWCISHNGTMDFYTCGQTATSDGSISCSTGETHRFTGFTNGSWHKLVQTVNGDTLKMYIDGSCVRTSTSASYGKSLRPNSWTAASIRNYTTIGNVWNSYYFEGYIKNVYLFDHELTSSEINSLQYR